uniref:Hairy/enhancer-of-split related with YRPW motif protein n=2 Tax=Timema TaxID=61471 RepID=A0A7R9F5H2_9NEOP|nr:unnamed protein product [Timema bartmani]
MLPPVSVTGTTRTPKKWRDIYPVHLPAVANAALLDCIPSGCRMFERGIEGTALHAATATPPHPRLSSRRQRQTSSSGVGVTLWRVVVPRGPAPPEPAEPLTPWGYPTPPCPSAAPWTPSKRNISESDDCDDVFSESSKEPCSSPADGDSYQLLSRKKRRGIIEKRRRDRINTSLTELRRLVPAAYEKQGSAKLEKAEILQLTVDHLKMLHAKAGMDVLTCDPHKFAMDYHNLGFRECASEVARYLVTVEGLDIQDPLRLRLMSHLQCFAAQRELATKQSSGNVPWGYGPADPGNCTSQHYSPPTTAQHEAAPPPPPPPSYDSPHVPTSSSASSNLAASYSQSHAHAHYPSNPGPHHQTSAYSSPSGASPSHVKPYRPWGAELAY